MLSLYQSPLEWNSLHRPIIFKFGYIGKDITIVESSGKCRITWVDSNPPTLKVGDLIFVYGSTVTAYNGYHTISAINSNIDVVTNIAFTSNAFATGKPLYVPTFQLWTGIDGSSQRPVQQIATIRPRANVYDNNTITVDVADFLKSEFPINPPQPGNDQSMYNRFRLIEVIGVSSQSTGYHYVLNGTETHIDTQAYADSNGFLSDETPILFSCGKTIFSTVAGTSIVTSVYDADTGETVDGSQVAIGTEGGEGIGTETTDEAIGIE